MSSGLVTSSSTFLLLGLGVFLWLALRTYKAAVVKSRVRGLPGPRPASWLAGNLAQIFSPTEAGLQFHIDIAKKFGLVAKVSGLFGDEQLYITDPLALHHILVKDGNNFEEDSIVTVYNGLIHGPCLAAAVGDLHRRQRKALNPSFSPASIKSLAPKLHEATHQLRDMMKTRLRENKQDQKGRLDLYDCISRASLQMIGQCGMGYDFKTLRTEATTKDEYARAMNDILPPFFKLQLEFVLLSSLAPTWARTFVNTYPKKAAKRIAEVISVLESTSQRILDTRKAGFASGKHSVDAPIDFVKLMLEQNESAPEAERLSEEEIRAQMSMLIFSATDTSSSALSRTVYMLAQSPEIQQHLRREIVAAKDKHEQKHDVGNRDLDYDVLMALPVLDAICRETLRLFPSLPYLTRICHKDTTVPLSQPVTLTDGTRVSSIPIVKGQKVFTGVVTANLEKSIWGEDADAWKPERWLTAAGADVPDLNAIEDFNTLECRIPKRAADAKLPGIYSGMMTFYGGKRSCIGFNFAQLEMKIILAGLVDAFRFEISEEEIVWTLGVITVPRVKGLEDGPPQLPLRVIAL